VSFKHQAVCRAVQAWLLGIGASDRGEFWRRMERTPVCQWPLLLLRGLHVEPPHHDEALSRIGREISEFACPAGLSHPAGRVTFKIDGEILAPPPRFAELVHRARSVTLRINSHGGCWRAFQQMLQAIEGKPCRADVTTAYSGACLLVQGCSERRIRRNGQMMLHPPIGAALGDSRSLRQVADWLDGHHDEFVALVQKRTGRTVAEVRAWFAGGDVYFTASQALEHGLVDEIIPIPDENPA